MTVSLMRSVGAIFASLVVAMALIIAVEAICAVFHPFPPGVDTSDFEVVGAHVANYPYWALAIGAVGWGGTTFLSSWVATRLGAGRHPAHGIAIGSLLLVAAGFNMFMLPYPLWFELANLLIIPLAIFGAVQLGRAPQPQQPVVEQEPDDQTPRNGD